MMEYVDLIGRVGFPIAISLYFIFKVEKVIKNNTIAMTKVYEIVSRCQK